MYCVRDYGIRLRARGFVGFRGLTAGGRPIKLPCRISLPNRRTGDNRLAQPNDPFRIRLARRQISQNVNKIELNYDGQRTAVYCDSP